MREADLHAVLAVQAACYPPAMREAAGVVLARLRTAPGTVLVACDAEGVCAYLFAYHSRLGAVTPLGAGFDAAPDADTLYLHDLAVAPRALGQGLARRLVASLLEANAALPWAALVAVQDSRRFWEGQGFAVREAGEGGARRLATYPGGAIYMARGADRPAPR
ncbi:GNAT family N-acetyltransferase [Massilia aerilata]|uniref:GNAT family N-acetyltransferase n=1 Tax=Massilia aerilata TaxID=453817 RepID=A0ABW0RTU1_9BURK